MNKPEKNIIPDLRWAACDAHGAPYADFIMLKCDCCYKCLYFGSTLTSSPLGWCELYPSMLENTSEFRACDAFLARNGKETQDELQMLKDHPENYSVGDYKLLRLGKHMTVMFKIVDVDGERKCVMQAIHSSN